MSEMNDFYKQFVNEEVAPPGMNDRMANASAVSMSTAVSATSANSPRGSPTSENSMSTRPFHGYLCLAAKSHTYGVPLSIQCA